MAATFLVTGGTGFVGLNIAEALLAAGHRVLAVDRGPPPPATGAWSAKGGFRHVVADVRDGAGLLALVREARPEGLVIGAALTAGLARERSDAAGILAVNCAGTINALDAALAGDVRRVVYLSSSTVYGENGFPDHALDEAVDTPLPDSLYSITKYMGERIALRYRALHGLGVVCLRLSAVYGPWERDTGARDTLSPVYQVTMAARQGQEAVLPRAGIRDWVYARDVGKAVLAALSAAEPPSGPFNVTPSSTFAIADWCQKLGQRYPGFRWRIGPEASIDYHGPRERSPMSARRIAEGLGWRAEFTADRAFADYMAWLDRNA
ncbi:MAG: NAD(P)-dependent oxidoreductase [Alphaproteobacteria bacterium]|nr:NAD(P)-dependent oxidoreductase [Alphaproteobacteria bacterium]